MSDEVCGSWRAIEYDHGHVSVEAWCRRVAGPCPYLGSIQSDRGDNRPCSSRVEGEGDGPGLRPAAAPSHPEQDAVTIGHQ